jgi:hypothetical protein
MPEAKPRSGQIASSGQSIGFFMNKPNQHAKGHDQHQSPDNSEKNGDFSLSFRFP